MFESKAKQSKQSTMVTDLFHILRFYIVLLMQIYVFDLVPLQ